MARKKRSLDAPPIEWVDQLERHTEHLGRVRMMWRRGGGDYRPLVSLDADLDELEAGPQSGWDRAELAETNFEWDVDGGDAHEEITEIVDQLWRHAVDWTRGLGYWCDFQLLGFGDDGEVLFEVGRRCQLSPPSRARDQAPPPPRDPQHGAFDSAAFERAFDRLDARKDKFIERLASDRDWSFDTAQQAMSAAPALFDRAGEILKDTIGYQQEVVRQVTSRAQGHVEFRARAFQEMERTRRFKLGGDLLLKGVESLGSTLIPFADRALELLLNHRVMVFPQFNSAQMAMSYLHESVRPTAWLRMLDHNRQAVADCRTLLMMASRMPDERAAVMEIAELIELLRSERFEQNVGPEEQLAGRYIISRYAIYRMEDVGEPEAS